MIYYNLADQAFKATSRASVGVYNVSMQMGIHLASRHPCRLLLNSMSDISEELAEIPVQRIQGCAGGIRRMVWDQWGLYRGVDATERDWLFLPKGFASFMRKPPCRLAVYVHDVVYAFWRKEYPGYRSRLLHTYFDWGLKASLRNADVIFTNSDFTAGELRRFADETGCTKRPEIVTAGIGFDHLLSAPCEQERSGILVYVSSWPHKDSGALLEKLARWQRQSGYDEPVYLLGSLPADVRVGDFRNWEILSALPEEEYRNLLGRVACTLSNSEYEGFGMPPGESLMQGAAPVYSSIPAMNEVMDGIGFSYDNSDYRSFSDALDSALSVEKYTLTDWKTNFMERHNWSNVVETISNFI